MAVLLAEMKGYQEVAGIISQEFDRKETRFNVYRFATTIRAKKIVPFLRNRFLKDIMKIPIANKSVRLARLEKIYHEAMGMSLKSVNAYGKIYWKQLAAAIDAMMAARTEIEGDKPLIDQSQHTHYHLGDRLKVAREKALAGRIPTAAI